MSQASLTELLADWRRWLQLFSRSGALAAAARDALQLEGEVPLLDRQLEAWARGEAPQLPPVLLLPAGAMKGAAGAYAAETGTILLNRHWLTGASRAQQLRVLHEELGHHLDALFNDRDSTGDEGELFAALLLDGGSIDPLRRRELQAEQDHRSLRLGGRSLTVEQAVVPGGGGAVSLSVSPAAVSEDGGSSLLYTFSRSGFTTQPLTVRFSVGGSAAFGSDYSQSGAASFASRSGTISFAAGAGSTTLSITPQADNGLEANESISLSLLAGSGYSLGTTAAATGTISNDDASVTLAVTPASVPEDSGSSLRFVFSRSGHLDHQLAVAFGVSGSALFSSDYAQSGASAFAASSGTIHFASGASTATLSISPSTDSTVEANESVAITLLGGSGYTLGSRSRATGTVSNDDALVSLTLAATSVLEDGSANLVARFSRSSHLSSELTVAFAVGGSAGIGTDLEQRGASSFSATSGTIRFARGSSLALLTLDPIADTTLEPDESVTLSLVAGSGYSIGPSSAVSASVRDDDAEISISPASAVVDEDGVADLLLVISRQGYLGKALSVPFTLGGSASFSTDYSLRGAASIRSGSGGTSGSLSFAAGTATATLTINPTADSSVEADETVILSLGNGKGYNLGAQASSTGTIRNDDPPAALPPATNAISQSVVLQADIASAGEVDSYSIDTITGAILRVSVSGEEDNLWPLIDLRDPQGNLLKSAPTFNSKEADLGFWDLVTGEASLEVRTQIGSTGAYNLTVAISTREELRSEVVRLTNLERQKEGLTPLVRSSLLDQAAAGHVQDMDDHDAYLAHTGSDGSEPVDRIQATGYKGAWVDLGNGSLRTISSENAASGQQSPAEVVTAWMNSPGHRAAIMDPAAREIGVGVEYDNEFRFNGIQVGTFYWVQTFGNPWSPGMTQWF